MVVVFQVVLVSRITRVLGLARRQQEKQQREEKEPEGDAVKSGWRPIADRERKGEE